VTAPDTEGAVDLRGAAASLEQATSSGRPSRRLVFTLVAIAAVALAWRIFYVLAIRKTVGVNGPNDYFLNGDAYYYHQSANLIAKGRWFVDPLYFLRLHTTLPSAGHPPFTSAYLSVFSFLGLDGVTDHRIAGSLMGAATVLIVGVVGWRVAGERTAILAAGVAAVYPLLWINDGMILGETAAQFAAALFLLAAYTFWRTPRRRNAMLLGLGFGLAALSRSEILLCFIIVVAPLCLLAGRGATARRERWKRLLVATTAAVMLMAPWMIFNTIRFGEPVLVTTGQGAVLSAGACDDVFYGTYIGYTANCFQGPWAPRGANEVERDAEPRRQALEYIGDHLDRFPIVVAARVGRAWDVFKVRQTTRLDWSLEGRGRGASWAGLLMFYALLPFAVGGLVRMRRTKVTILPIVGLAVSFTVAVATTFGLPRYRAPFEVALVVVAAVGMDRALAWMDRRRPSAGSAVGGSPAAVVT